MKPRINATFGPPKMAICPHCGQGPVYWTTHIVWDRHEQRLRPGLSDAQVISSESCTCVHCGNKSVNPAWRDTNETPEKAGGDQ